MSKEKKALVKNISSLFVVQIANFVFPLISVPIVARIIGPDKFGLINYAYAIVAYFVLLINFGFDYTATRKVAQNKDDKKYIEDIFALVLGSKIFLLTLSAIIFGAAYLFVPVFQTEGKLLLYTFLICFAWVITPNWLYQAKQELHKTAVFNLVTKLIFTVVILLLIKQRQDYVYQPLAISISQILVGVYSFVYAIKRYELKVKLPAFKDILAVLMEEKLIFFSSVVMSLYTTTNIVILGAFSNNFEVGYYTGASRLITIAQALIAIPLAQSLFPFIGKSFGQSTAEGIKVVQKIAPIIVTFTFLSGIAMISIGPYFITLFYGAAFGQSADIFRILSFIPFIVSISNIYGIQVMMNLRMDKAFFRITIIGAVTSIALNCVMVNFYGAVGAAITWVCTEVLITSMMGSYLSSHNIKIFTLDSFKRDNFLLLVKPFYDKLKYKV